MIESKYKNVSIYFLLQISIVALILFKIIKFYWDRRRLYICALKFPGPVALPLIGNALHFAGKTEDLLKRVCDIVNTYASPCRIWFGHKLTVVVYEPEDLEVILTDTVNIKKDITYSYMEPFLGQGLISNSAFFYFFVLHCEMLRIFNWDKDYLIAWETYAEFEYLDMAIKEVLYSFLIGPTIIREVVQDCSLWKTHRRLIIPTFTSKTLRNYIESFNTQSKVLVEKLQPQANTNKLIDIIDYLNLCTIDVVLSTVLGIEAGAQSHQIDTFVEHVELAYKMVHERMLKAWLHLDAIFRLSSCYRNTLKAQKVIHEFAVNNLLCIKDEFARNYKDGLVHEGNVRTTLEHLLLINQKGNDFFTDIELRDETYTLFTASQDTVATSCAFILLMLAMHPEIQEKVYQEILQISKGDKDYFIEWETYAEFEYLEMVIKEALRLFPIGPTIMREVVQDVKLKNNVIVPKGASIMIVMFKTHRLPQYWPDPEKFIPERFLPELNVKRNSFSYVPFSAGPRSCIAPKYAMFAMKTIVSHVIRSYKLTSELKYEDLELTCDISTRSRYGYKMRLESRH